MMAVEAGELMRSSKKRMLKVEVMEGDKSHVNITVPLSLAKLALKFIPKDANMKLNECNVDINDLHAILDSEDLGEIVIDVLHENKTVKVYVE